MRNNRVEVIHVDNKKKETFDIRDNRLALHRPRFAIGALVSAFQPNWAYQVQFTIVHGQVVKHHCDGSYGIRWETARGAKILAIPEHYVFAKNKNRYHKGQEVMSCWTDYALNKNSPYRYKKYKAVIKNVNENGTYAVDFEIDEDNHRYSQCVREMWITSEREEKENRLAIEQWDDDPVSSLCVKVARQWTPRCVATFLLECEHEGGLSFSEKISMANALRRVQNKRIGGEEFTSMTEEDLITQLGMPRNLAKYFYGRFMYWIHVRMDSPPENAQKKRDGMPFDVPGGGKLDSRRS